MAAVTEPSYTLGEYLRKARTDAGLDQDAVAAAVGVSRQLVSKWERDVSIPDVIEFHRIIERTGAVWLHKVQLRMYLTVHTAA